MKETQKEETRRNLEEKDYVDEVQVKADRSADKVNAKEHHDRTLDMDPYPIKPVDGLPVGP